MSIPITHLDSTDSTNTHARRLVEAGQAAPPFIIVARTQSAGRGQFSRSWSSPAGGLWCTHAFHAPPNTDALGLRIGLACARTVESALRRGGNGNDVRLKWPNDIYVANKKILGVLTEGITANSQRVLLIGVGINANFLASELPPGVAAGATTLLDRIGGPTDLPQLLSDLTHNLGRALSMSGLEPAALAEARFRLHGVGKPTEIRTPDNQAVRGTLVGLDDLGQPIIQTDAGRVTAAALAPF